MAQFEADSFESLKTAISDANASTDDTNTIVIEADIDLDGFLGIINPQPGTVLVIDGGGFKIDGGGEHRIFFVNTGTVVIQDVTLANGAANGGDGGSGLFGAGGGGGLGAGGALFVRGSLDGHTAASVTLDGVAFDDNSATGGDGGADPEISTSGATSGGGGGMGGHGGDGIADDFGGAGGGGAFAGDDGEDGSGGAGGGDSGFAGGNGSAINNGAGGQGQFGGGGGGSYNTTGAAGGFGGGGGGGGTGGNITGGAGGFGGGGAGGDGGAGFEGAGGFGAGNGGQGITGSDAGGGGAGLGGAIFVMEGATLTITGGGGMSGGAATGGAGGASEAGPAPGGSGIGAGMFLHGDGTLAISGADEIVFEDSIADQTGNGGEDAEAGSWSITKTGAGRLVLSGDNSYSGSTHLNGGTIRAESDTALGEGELIYSDGVLELADGVAIGNSASINDEFEIFVDTEEMAVIFGVIDDGFDGGGSGTGNGVSAHGVKKLGGGILTLTGQNLYDGLTDVLAGTLQVFGDNSASMVSVALGATLRGTGSVGDVTVASGGRLMAGRVIPEEPMAHATGELTGTLSTGAVVLVAGATLALNLEDSGLAGFDQIAASGMVHLGGSNLVLALTHHGRPREGEAFRIIDNDGSDAVVGRFAGLKEGVKFEVDDLLFRISYKGGTGNDVVVTKINVDIEGTAGADVVTASETVAGEAFASLDDDTVHLGAGDDRANGAAGHDRLFGQSGADRLAGGAGDDDLFGGTGFDTLTGGVGGDRFHFNTALPGSSAGADRIVDFVHGVDKIVLSDTVFSEIDPGGLTKSAFLAAGKATTEEHRILYNPEAGKLFYDADGSKKAFDKVHFATLSKDLNLTHTDFQLS